MAYSELIKNFEGIRMYLRDFYVYGYKSRLEYQHKSARSYDDERRRIESWLSDYVGSAQHEDGKNLYLSLDSRVIEQNPFYRIWKSKSFTDKSITLYFLLFDILYDASVKKTLQELIEEIESYLSLFENPLVFDESTLRKKLKEYIGDGLLKSERIGKAVYYHRNVDWNLDTLLDALSFFAECAPCGVIGSYLQDTLDESVSYFSFKHHYITQTMDADILAVLFDAMQKQCYVTLKNQGRHTQTVKTLTVVPLKVYISAQNGRQYLIAFYEKARNFSTYRLDYLSEAVIGEKCLKFEAYRRLLQDAEKHMWGVNCHLYQKYLEHVEFDVCVNEQEDYIIKRLEREKRCGEIVQVEPGTYRFIADVYDTSELIPWIRTFICRITRLHFSNRTIENRLRDEMEQMYAMYDLNGGDML